MKGRPRRTIVTDLEASSTFELDRRMESEVGGLWQLEEEEHEAFGQALADGRYDEPRQNA